jgi:hypothetical protein
MQVPEGHKIVMCVGYTIPDTFHAIESTIVTGRRWWQFWLPKAVFVYMNIVEIEQVADVCGAHGCCGGHEQ